MMQHLRSSYYTRQGTLRNTLLLGSQISGRVKIIRISTNSLTLC